ncbi:nuclear RNA export factor 1 [Ditylenchus destructor]|nr:nuclear RNA export factor 1 [Ditylenchus destructor]
MSRQDGGSRGPRGRRNVGVKDRTMNRFTVFDPDVASQYDYDDDEQPAAIRQKAGARGAADMVMRALGGRVGGNARENKQLLNRAGGGRKELIFLVTVRNAARTGKERVLRLLSDSVTNFRPIAPKTNACDIEFYLTSNEDTEAVRLMSRRLADSKNPSNKYIIFATKQPAPWEQLKPNTKHIIEDVVKNRYSPLSNSLDLSDFTNDRKFADAGVHCALFNNAVMVHVADIVNRNFATIQGLSLKGNRLRLLDFTSTLVFAAPHVVELDLSDNALTRIDELDRIRGWHIEKLHLENNELVSKFTEASSYASAVHDYFPRVNYLDGVYINVDPLKLNANEDESGDNLPPYRTGFCPDANIRTHVESFLLEYLSLYDGANGEETRKRLMNAYDDNAIFTYSISTVRDARIVPRGDDDAYQNYIRSSHNILRESNWSRYRDKIVYKGAMDVAVALSKLPLTNHVKDSFVLDFNFISSNLVVFTLQGIFRDGKDAFRTDGDSKYFVRNFVAVPKPDNTMAILSDMLTLTPIGLERMVRFNKLLKQSSEMAQREQLGISHSTDFLSNMDMNTNAFAPPPPPTPQPPMTAIPAPLENQPTSSSAPIYNVNDPYIQQEMIKQFCQASGMKAEWSEKCLKDMAWNFEEAGRVFAEMKDRIPPEAFA